MAGKVFFVGLLHVQVVTEVAAPVLLQFVLWEILILLYNLNLKLQYFVHH